MAYQKERAAALKTLGEYFVEKGKILTRDEYTKAQDKPVPASRVAVLFRTYNAMLKYMQGREPELYQKALEGKPVVKQEPKSAVEAMTAAIGRKKDTAKDE